MDIESIHNSKSNGGTYGRRKDIERPKFKSSLVPQLNMVNDPTECIYILKRLNDVITTLCIIGDDYYTHYIWNISSDADSKLKEAGFTEDYFYEVEKKLTELRSLLVGDNLDMDWLVNKLYDELLAYESYWQEFHESTVNELRRENEKLKKQIKEKS